MKVTASRNVIYNGVLHRAKEKFEIAPADAKNLRGWIVETPQAQPTIEDNTIAEMGGGLPPLDEPPKKGKKNG